MPSFRLATHLDREEINGEAWGEHGVIGEINVPNKILLLAKISNIWPSPKFLDGYATER